MAEVKKVDGKSIVQGGIQGALSLFGGAVTSAVEVKPEKVTEKLPQDIPKEELMALCMKLNKRMQSMETKSKDLLRKQKSLIEERKCLVELISSTVTISIGVQDDHDLNIDLIQDSWAQWKELHRESVVKLEQKVSEVEQTSIKSKSVLEAKYRKEISDLQQLLSNGSGAEPSVAANGDPSVNAQESKFYIAEFDRVSKENEELQASILDYQSKCRKYELEIERHRTSEDFFRNQISTLESDSREKTEKVQNLQKEMEDTRVKKEEAIMYLQMQVNTLKERDESRERESAAAKRQMETAASQIASLQLLVEEKGIAVQSNKDVIQALQIRLKELEPDVDRLREKNRELDRNVGAAAFLKAEQDSLLSLLRKDLRSALEGREEALKRTKELEEYRMKAEGQMMKLSSLSEQVSSLQAGIEDKTSLITRLRAEAQVSDRNHAMRTAMLATCEAQIDTLRAEMAIKEETARESTERLGVLQERLAGAEARLEERLKEAQARIEAIENDAKAATAASEAESSALRDAHELALESLKREHAKKSATARLLVSEKEEEVRQLQARVKDQQSEIASGAPSERRIFELAQVQAKRDAVYGIHNDTREVAFQQLQSAIAAKDLELAQVQQSQSQLAAEVAELRRHTKREGVNMDYLKNVVLQYMSFPVQAPERGSLVPVIAMLLQFNVRELAEAEKALREPIWSTRPVKEVKRSLTRAAQNLPPEPVTESSKEGIRAADEDKS